LSFTASGEQITLSHRAFDRKIFAAGATRAAAWLVGRPPGLYGIDEMLGQRPARERDRQ
jgi:4-hydroxy-tetrahydrodipicolinate reductase